MLSGPVIQKLASKCNKDCKTAKRKAFKKIDKLSKEIERQESEWDKVNERMTVAAKVFDEINTIASTYKEQRSTNPKTWLQSKNSLLNSIDRGRKEGYLTEDQSVTSHRVPRSRTGAFTQLTRDDMDSLLIVSSTQRILVSSKLLQIFSPFYRV